MYLYVYIYIYIYTYTYIHTHTSTVMCSRYLYDHVVINILDSRPLPGKLCWQRWSTSVATFCALVQKGLRGSTAKARDEMVILYDLI